MKIPLLLLGAGASGGQPQPQPRDPLTWNASTLTDQRSYARHYDDVTGFADWVADECWRDGENTDYRLLTSRVESSMYSPETAFLFDRVWQAPNLPTPIGLGKDWQIDLRCQVYKQLGTAITTSIVSINRRSDNEPILWLDYFGDDTRQTYVWMMRDANGRPQSRGGWTNHGSGGTGTLSIRLTHSNTGGWIEAQVGPLVSGRLQFSTIDRYPDLSEDLVFRMLDRTEVTNPSYEGFRFDYMQIRSFTGQVQPMP